MSAQRRARADHGLRLGEKTASQQRGGVNPGHGQPPSRRHQREEPLVPLAVAFQREAHLPQIVLAGRQLRREAAAVDGRHQQQPRPPAPRPPPSPGRASGRGSSDPTGVGSAAHRAVGPAGLRRPRPASPRAGKFVPPGPAAGRTPLRRFPAASSSGEPTPIPGAAGRRC